VFKTEDLAGLRGFRQELYDGLGHRQDSLFELVDAVLSAAVPQPLVRLSLSPAFRRRWPSTCDALADGGVAVAALRQLFVRQLPGVAGGEREVWALDGSAWPRPSALTSPERTWEYRPVAGQPQQHLVPAWEYQWLVRVPEPPGSWVLPVDVHRRGPGAGTPTQLAIAQLRRGLAARPSDAPRPVVAVDSSYTPGELAQAQVNADVLARLARRRCLYRAPGPYRGRGPRPTHGPPFKLHEPATHGPADHTATGHDPLHGQVSVAVWTTLHERAWPRAPFAVVRVQVEHLAQQDRPPAPLWLAWIGGPLPDDLLQLWRWYARRFVIEHAFRFSKHDLGWTTVRVRQPAAADRWTWLLAAALWQLWLARALVGDQRLPWERPADPARLTPGRVRRAWPGLLPALGSPARAPRTRGKAPGRQPGQTPGPHPRCPVVRRRPSRTRRCHCPQHHRHRTAA
jgi:hypothetical protein